jgi:hypothetical protein
MYYINTSIIKITGPHLLNEFEHMMKKLLRRKHKVDEVVLHPRPFSASYGIRGVPQGSPTSPILAVLLLEGSIHGRPGIKSMGYADDGTYYGDLSDTPLITPNTPMVKSNIYFNLDKTG